MEEEREAVRPSEKETRSPVIQVRRLYKIYRVGETKVHALNGVQGRVLCHCGAVRFGKVHTFKYAGRA